VFNSLLPRKSLRLNRPTSAYRYDLIQFFDHMLLSTTALRLDSKIVRTRKLITIVDCSACCLATLQCHTCTTITEIIYLTSYISEARNVAGKKIPVHLTQRNYMPEFSTMLHKAFDVFELS